MNLFDQAVEEGYTIVTTVSSDKGLVWQAIGMAMQQASALYREVIVLCKTYSNKSQEWFIMGRD